MLISLIVVTISQHIYSTSKHQVVYIKYIQFLFLFSKKLKFKKRKIEIRKVEECNKREKEIKREKKNQKRSRRRGRRKERKPTYTGNSKGPPAKTYLKQLESKEYS